MVFFLPTAALALPRFPLPGHVPSVKLVGPRFTASQT
jgi:hypothetical protein